VTQQTVRILSIDGGGIRGILPARLLQEIERQTGQPGAELFDLVAGTSTGGIIACGIARRISATRLGEFYASNGGKIFTRSFGREVATLDGLFGPDYDPRPLERMLREVLGETWLSEVTRPHLLIPSYCVALPPSDRAAGRERPSAMFFKSWKANGVSLDAGDVQETLDFPLWQVARATSAAPTYFPPAWVTSKSGERAAMIDGGVFANNPSACALASARRLYPEAKRYLIVSLGTGAAAPSIDADATAGWGKARWMRPMFSIFMAGAADAASYQVEQDPKVRHLRFQVTIAPGPDAPSTAMDDAEPDNVRRLELLAQRMIETNRDRLIAAALGLAGGAQ
jgi:patatin-like phospholipase/acyl hydrolase